MGMHKIPMDLIIAMMPDGPREEATSIRRTIAEMMQNHEKRMDEISESMEMKYGFRGPAMRHLVASMAKHSSLMRLLTTAAVMDETLSREIHNISLGMTADAIGCCAVMAQNIPADTKDATQDDEIVQWAKTLFEEEMTFNVMLHMAGLPLGKLVADFMQKGDPDD